MIVLALPSSLRTDRNKYVPRGGGEGASTHADPDRVRASFSPLKNREHNYRRISKKKRGGESEVRRLEVSTVGPPVKFDDALKPALGPWKVLSSKEWGPAESAKL